MLLLGNRVLTFIPVPKSSWSDSCDFLQYELVRSMKTAFYVFNGFVHTDSNRFYPGNTNMNSTVSSHMEVSQREPYLLPKRSPKTPPIPV